MAEWVEQWWEPVGGPGLGRRSRMGGKYLAFVPDPLSDRPLHIPSGLSKTISRVESKILALSDNGNSGGSFSATGLEGVSRFLLRAEAISSSRIEGIAPGPDKVAIAELLSKGSDPRVASVPELVANNVVVLQQISEQLRDGEDFELSDIVAAQSLLLGDSRIEGLRDTQNWIGGSSYSPVEAEFVPPPAVYVPDLMKDLVDYLNGATHGALIQAGLVHAQFETIHPFGDGNGRIGRALIHAVLQRRGLVRSPVLPISLILNTWSERYVHGLTRFRDDAGDSTGICEWLEVFVEASSDAADQAARIASELVEVRKEWLDRVKQYRQSQGMTRALRTDSMERKILDSLPDHPVLTAAVAADLFGKTTTAAGNALDSLAASGVLRKRSIDRGVTGYLADDVFEVITWAERRLASTKFDTEVSPPIARAVPRPPGS